MKCAGEILINIFATGRSQIYKSEAVLSRIHNTCSSALVATHNAGAVSVKLVHVMA